jgi:hypothetical protein
MFPCSTEHDAYHGTCHYPELFRKSCGGDTFAIKMAHFSNLIRSQLGCRAKFTTAIAPLIDAITNVVGACSKKKMRRIHASWVVAAMTNKHAFGDGAKVQVIRQAVGQPSSSRLDVAIPLNTDIALPVPTLVGKSGGNVSPKQNIFRRRIEFPFAEVAFDVIPGLPFNPSKAGIGTRRNLGFLSATAMTKAVGNILCGILHGITVSFQTVSKPGTCTASPGIFVSSCDYTTPTHLHANGGA